MEDVTTIEYKGENLKVEGTPERPKRPGNVWYFSQTDSVSKATDGGAELFILTEIVVGSWETLDELEEYQAVYVPRPANWPPIQRVTMRYFDSSGSMQKYVRREAEDK